VKGRFRTSAWHGLRLTGALVLLSLAVFAFWEVVEGLVEEPMLRRVDLWLQALLEGIPSPGLTRFMATFTDTAAAGLAAAAILLMVLLHLFRRSWWDLYTLALATGSGQVLLLVLKLFFARPRPGAELVAATGYSFPSGHSFNAMLFGGLFVLLVRSLPGPGWIRGALTALAAALILAVGFSRLYLNVHWLTDVLAGYAAGLAWLMISVILARTVRHWGQVLQTNKL
jgi:undecaprenyl-diphosphatase